MNDTSLTQETAVFGGGCFWCTEAVYQQLKGVISVMPGYAGGTVPNPTYDQVCSGKTGHAEVIQITFDPAQVSYNNLLTVFFATHNPTTMNRQGNDVGPQYRSSIFSTNDEQKNEAEAFVKNIDDPQIVTTVEPLTTFYPAENYHRDYYRTHASEPYCELVINPKLQKLRADFAELLKTQGTSFITSSL